MDIMEKAMLVGENNNERNNEQNHKSSSTVPKWASL